MSRPLLQWLAVTAMLLVLTAAVTFPQVQKLTTSVSDLGDPLLNAWILAWNAHAIATPGADLVDANIFYPEKGTLAFSETLIFPALLSAPLSWAGVSPLTTYNITLLSGFVLSGLSMFLLVRSLTNDWTSALVSSVSFAVSPLRLDQYAHLQMQMTYLMPFALYLIRSMWIDPKRLSTGLLLGVTLAALFYSCVYYAIYFVTLVPVFVLLLSVRHRPRGRVVATGAAAVVAALALIAPVAGVYRQNSAVVGERGMDDVRRGSASAEDYARPYRQSLLYGGFARNAPAERRLFPGITSGLLAASAVVASPSLALPFAGPLIVAFDSSLGTNGHIYPFLHAFATPYRALRMPARFAMLVAMFLAVLAGLGVAAICGRLRTPVARRAVVAIALTGIVAESLNRPLPLLELTPQEPAVYKWLAAMHPGPVFEYPISDLEGRLGPQDATYMYYSTLHWMPLLNGYSGFAPPSYFELRDAMRTFPDRNAILYLKRRDARYILVHQRYYLRGGFEDDVAVLEGDPNVRRVAYIGDPANGPTVVYEIR
jgi:hypothetical protein